MNLIKILFIVAGVISLTLCDLEFLWPFNNKTNAFEVLRSISGQDGRPGCKMNFTNLKPTDFLFSTIVLDGSLYFDIPVENVLVTDYAFSGWFWSSTDKGTLFHYKTRNPTDILRELKIWLVLNQVNIARVLKTKTETDVLATTFSTNTWYYISFGIETSTGSMRVYMDENKVYDNDIGYSDNVSFTPGILRIGGSFDSLVQSFNGIVTCLGFHSDSFPHLNITKPLCTSQTWATYKSMCTAINDQSKLTIGRFVVYTGSTSDLEIINAVNPCSVIECGSKCLEDSNCQYFQHVVLTPGYCECYLLTTGIGNVDPAKGTFYVLVFIE